MLRRTASKQRRYARTGGAARRGGGERVVYNDTNVPVYARFYDVNVELKPSCFSNCVTKGRAISKKSDPIPPRSSSGVRIDYDYDYSVSALLPDRETRLYWSNSPLGVPDTFGRKSDDNSETIVGASPRGTDIHISSIQGVLPTAPQAVQTSMGIVQVQQPGMGPQPYGMGPQPYGMGPQPSGMGMGYQPMQYQMVRGGGGHTPSLRQWHWHLPFPPRRPNIVARQYSRPHAVRCTTRLGSTHHHPNPTTIVTHPGTERHPIRTHEVRF
jgi:hypothetical protein